MLICGLILAHEQTLPFFALVAVPCDMQHIHTHTHMRRLQETCNHGEELVGKVSELTGGSSQGPGAGGEAVLVFEALSLCP